MTEVVAIEDDGAAAGPLKLSKETSVFAEKYEIVWENYPINERQSALVLMGREYVWYTELD